MITCGQLAPSLAGTVGRRLRNGITMAGSFGGEREALRRGRRAGRPSSGGERVAERRAVSGAGPCRCCAGGPATGSSQRQTRHGPPTSGRWYSGTVRAARSEEHTSEIQSRGDVVCRRLLEKKYTTCALRI